MGGAYEVQKAGRHLKWKNSPSVSVMDSGPCSLLAPCGQWWWCKILHLNPSFLGLPVHSKQALYGKTALFSTENPPNKEKPVRPLVPFLLLLKTASHPDTEQPNQGCFSHSSVSDSLNCGVVSPWGLEADQGIWPHSRSYGNG